MALTSAAGVDVEPIWASLLAKALEGKDVKDMLSNVGAGGGGPAVGGGAAPAAGAAPAEAAAEAKEEKKEEEKDESDDDMVRVLFSSSRLGVTDGGSVRRALVYSTNWGWFLLCDALSLFTFIRCMPPPPPTAHHTTKKSKTVICFALCVIDA